MKNNGVLLYRLIGKILIGCGIGWLLLALILGSYLYLYVIALIHICLGLLILLATKRFSNFINDDYKKYLKEKEKLESRLQVGKVVLPITHGDF